MGWQDDLGNLLGEIAGPRSSPRHHPMSDSRYVPPSSTAPAAGPPLPTFDWLGSLAGRYDGSDPTAIQSFPNWFDNTLAGFDQQGAAPSGQGARDDSWMYAGDASNYLRNQPPGALPAPAPRVPIDIYWLRQQGALDSPDRPPRIDTQVPMRLSPAYRDARPIPNAPPMSPPRKRVRTA